MLASRQTAPATTGEATLVPDRDLQPPWILLPITSLPYAMTSGCTSAGSHRVPAPAVSTSGWTPAHTRWTGATAQCCLMQARMHLAAGDHRQPDP